MSQVKPNTTRWSDEPKQVIVVLGSLGRGKAAAAAAHASLGVFLDRVVYRTGDSMTIGMSRSMYEWVENGCAKIVVSVETEREVEAAYLAAKKVGLPTALIQDAGRTEVSPGTYTACAIGPASPELIDPITRKLPLLK